MFRRQKMVPEFGKGNRILFCSSRPASDSFLTSERSPPANGYSTKSATGHSHRVDVVPGNVGPGHFPMRRERAPGKPFRFMVSFLRELRAQASC